MQTDSAKHSENHERREKELKKLQVKTAVQEELIKEMKQLLAFKKLVHEQSFGTQPTTESFGSHMNPSMFKT